MATGSPCAQAARLIAGTGVQDWAGLGVGGLSGGAVALVEADQREAERGEDGSDAAGGIHGIRPQVRRDLVE
jgi:hypothetical protein